MIVGRESFVPGTECRVNSRLGNLPVQFLLLMISCFDLCCEGRAPADLVLLSHAPYFIEASRKKGGEGALKSSAVDGYRKEERLAGLCNRDA